jgi:hypothetical protein
MTAKFPHGGRNLSKTDSIAPEAPVDPVNQPREAIISFVLFKRMG